MGWGSAVTGESWQALCFCSPWLPQAGRRELLGGKAGSLTLSDFPSSLQVLFLCSEPALHLAVLNVFPGLQRPPLAFGLQQSFPLCWQDGRSGDALMVTLQPLPS